MNHELQHSDGDDSWCVHCGVFTRWLDDTPCEGYKGEYNRQFDFNQPDNWKRQAVDMFRQEAISG